MDARADTAGAGGDSGAIVVRATRPVVVEGTIVDVADLAAGGARRAVAARGSAFRPRDDVWVRAGTLADLPFIDALQKANSRAVGFLPTMALEGKIRLGEVLIAEVGDSPRRHGDTEKDESMKEVSESSVPPCLRVSVVRKSVT